MTTPPTRSTAQPVNAEAIEAAKKLMADVWVFYHAKTRVEALGHITLTVQDAINKALAREREQVRGRSLLEMILSDTSSKQAIDALRDCQDFLQAIVDSTEGAGRIDENSIMRPGERLKTTAHKLNARAKTALAQLEASKPSGEYLSACCQIQQQVEQAIRTALREHPTKEGE